MAIEFNLKDAGLLGEKLPPSAPADLESQPDSTIAPAGPAGRLRPDQAFYRDQVIFCGECLHFQDPNTCDLVQGPISVDGTCSFAEYGIGGDTDAEGLDEGAAEELAESRSGANESGRTDERAEIS